jgi:hypothetical protein
MEVKEGKLKFFILDVWFGKTLEDICSKGREITLRPILWQCSTKIGHGCV